MVIALWAAPGAAFEVAGHEAIEAAAYKRLLALQVVPGTGDPGISGRALLASLIAAGILAEPPCFDRDKRRGNCGDAQRLELPLRYWPLLLSGSADILIDRQLGQNGQCQHFMANTDDSLTPLSPGLGVPGGLVTTAYLRCIDVAGAVLDGILRDPLLAEWRLAGTYVLMHAIEDSFSAAHVDRNPQFQMKYLLSWTLIDWPRYALQRNTHITAATHHAVTDHRDYDYLRGDAQARDGRPCRDFHQPYAVPEECLTERGKAAVDAIFDYLVLIYQLRARALAEHRQVSLFGPSSGQDASMWMGYVRDHLASTSVQAGRPGERREAPPRNDGFLGLQGVAGRHALGAGIWGAHLWFGPAIPFALGLTGGTGYTRSNGAGEFGAAANLALVLPLIRRFAIGGAPVGFNVACTTDFDSCKPDVVATLGQLIVNLGQSTWLAFEGPRWSWTEREVGDTWMGVSLGWSRERVERRRLPRAEAVATWAPPPPADVRAYRHTRSSRTAYLSSTAGSRSDNAFIGVGLEWRRDRDVWDRRAGFAPGLQFEVDRGRVDGSELGTSATFAPTLRLYLVPDRVALTATPALVRVGTLGGHAVGVDVAGRAGVAFELGRVEIDVDSPPLSYVSRSRWDALPFSVRLGLRFD
jgi:hypothetical protein